MGWKELRYSFWSVWVCLFLKCRRHYVNHIVTQVLACVFIHGVNNIKSVIGGHLFVQAVICMYPCCTSVCPRLSAQLHLLYSVWVWAQSCMCVRKKSPVLLCSALCFWCKFKWQYFYFIDRKMWMYHSCFWSVII